MPPKKKRASPLAKSSASNSKKQKNLRRFQQREAQGQACESSTPLAPRTQMVERPNSFLDSDSNSNSNSNSNSKESKARPAKSSGSNKKTKKASPA
ncbi:hypothetical protein TL16_g04630 [Triparma laevis f. inornata]|uniref:Uncharacterized protein n=2 Tax=Triparma laevis TaxID=1534972 RepID=A0A9W7FFU7_9STRA|nr:hypothetical protein TL16_g04630 [Triparma laevis f. inornata]GMI11428.1 hypothetical protein TrLO_g5171 [Triparma laevis f. longispina]